MTVVHGGRSSGERRGAGEHHDDWLKDRTVAALERVFGWTRENILGAQALSALWSATTTSRFKMASVQSEASDQVFAVYAYYVAKVALQGVADCPVAPIPVDPKAMRQRIQARREGTVDFRTVLQTVWDLGVVVLPLRGEGELHTACWQYEGRNLTPSPP